MVDQHFGGSFNAHKHWKKLREKHAKSKSGEKRWKPERHEPPSNAGKGDLQRDGDIPEEIYNLNWDLAFGMITPEEHKKMVEKFWEDYTS